MDPERLLNVGLRFATLGVRFLFVFFLARYLDAGSVGYYGVFTATVSFALYFVGMDYYTYVTRELLAVGPVDRGRMLKGQMALSGILYLGLLPFGLLFLARVGWPGHLVWWFLPILVFEHVNQEIFRILVAMSHQIAASILLFVRQGSWAIAVVILVMARPASRNLDSIMALWAVAGLAAVLIGVWQVARTETAGWRRAIDWGWVKKGVGVSGGLLVATLALRGMQTVDRYWLEALAGIETVGAYVLFLGVAGALMVFLDAGIFSFTYPALIRYRHKGEHAEARRMVRQMFWYTVIVSALFAVVSWVLLPWLLLWVGNPVYERMLFLYPWVLGAMLLNAVGLVPHYGLYAAGHDRPIIVSHIVAFLIFALATLLLRQATPILAVPIALSVAFLFILVAKSLAYWWLVTRRGLH